MTDELFRDDADLAECTARVIAVDARGVQLDRTVFYPQGGGQAGDRGVLVAADGRELAIADTRKGEAPGEIVHVPAPAEGADASVPSSLPTSVFAVGDEVVARIDVDRRMRHRRFPYF
jgi:misacylated tRNA(Ala) deacylase